MKSNINIPVRYLKLWLTIIILGVRGLVFAQTQQFILKGVVFKNGVNQRLDNILAANLKNNVIVITDALGVFEMKCAIGDSILFRQKDYLDQKIAVTSANTLMVFMQPVINLQEVNIKGLTKKQELDQMMKDYGSHGIYNNGKPTVVSAIFSPLNALYDVFGSGPKQARRFQRYAANELEQQEVSRKFTATMVQQVTGLKDEKLKNFMDSYRPIYQDCKNWNQYDAITYIKKWYDVFEKEGEPARPKLY